MTAASSAQQVTESVVRAIAQAAVANEARFSELDSVVGDGDFGFSLARGFEKVLAEFDSLDRSSPGTFLKKVGLIITSRCGGTSGPLWGTAFLRAGAAFGEQNELHPAAVVAGLRTARAHRAASCRRAPPHPAERCRRTPRAAPPPRRPDAARSARRAQRPPAETPCPIGAPRCLRSGW